jgi:uncharacterized protein (PEP-CTERM system associated)
MTPRDAHLARPECESRLRFRTASRARGGRRLTHALAVGAFAVASFDAAGQTWRIEPIVTGDFTFTNNVDLSPAATRKSDFVTTITPGVRIDEKGAHSSLAGTILLPVVLYARTDERDSVRPEAHIHGMLELYPRLFFVDGSIQVSQEYFSPFGARPQNIVNVTDNRYTAQSFRISPYLKGETGTYAYGLRDNNTWTNENRTPTTTERAYTNEIFGYMRRTPQPLGWGVDYDRSDTRFTGQQPFITEIGRGSVIWRPEPQWELTVSGGYEDNRYPFADFAGATYGIGVQWHPTSRTSVDARWEHRFFGSSYLLSLDHRTPLSVWTFRVARDITSYPQQLARLAGAPEISTFLNTLFSSRIPDPAARQQLIDLLIRERALPPALFGPISVYHQQITLEESIDATVGLLGARNTIFIRPFWLRSEPIGG